MHATVLHILMNSVDTYYKVGQAGTCAIKCNTIMNHTSGS